MGSWFVEDLKFWIQTTTWYSILHPGRYDLRLTGVDQGRFYVQYKYNYCRLGVFSWCDSYYIWVHEGSREILQYYLDKIQTN